MVNWENYEEYMLLYADNELNEAEKQALLAFVEAHPELRKELDAYTATQLVPDKQIVFADKESLIKKEPGKTIALGKWWAYAAAAAVILFAVVIVKQNNKDEDTNVPLAKTETISQPARVTTDTSKDLHSLPVNPVTIENNIAKQEPANASKAPVKHISPKPVAPVPQLQQPKPETYITKEEPKKAIPAPVTEQKTEEQVAVNNPVIEKTAPVAEATPSVAKAEKKRRGLLAFLPIRKEKKEGFDVLADAVNGKLDKVKNIREQLKDTDVSVKIGNTELFVVKL